MQPPHQPAPQTDERVLSITRPHSNLIWVYALRAAAGLFLAPILFVPLYFKYHTLRYRFDEEGVSASWGIFFRREVYLTYKRIQDIHVKRNLIERWLGIGTVDVQTAAGSSSADLAIEGMADYEVVRDFLYRRMRGHELAVAQPSSTASAPSSDTLALLRDIRNELERTRRALESRI